MQAIRANGENNFSYNQKTKIQDPLNLIAMDMVRCMNCSKYFPLNEIHNHLRIHEKNLGYEQPYSILNDGRSAYNKNIGHPPPSRIKILNLDHDDGKMSDTVSTISRTKFTPIDVQTMVPEQLPEPDNIRRAISKPLPVNVVNQGSAINPTEGKTQPDMRSTAEDFVSEVNGPRIEDLREHFEKEDYYEPINISKTRVEINSKSINIYNNQTHVDVDSHVDLRKDPGILQPPSTPRNGPYWKAERIVQQSTARSGIQNTQIKPDRTIHPKQLNTKTFSVQDKNVVRVDQEPTRITTRTRTDRRIDSNDPPYTTESRIIFPDNPNAQPSCSWFKCGSPRDISFDHTQHTRVDYACVACGGFFCPVCKSTIPPQFRLPPGIKEYLAHSRSTHITHGGTPARQ